MRISDWSSDVCSSDLPDPNPISAARPKESPTSQEGEFFIWRPLGPTRAGAFFGPAAETNVRSGILRSNCRRAARAPPRMLALSRWRLSPALRPSLVDDHGHGQAVLQGNGVSTRL